MAEGFDALARTLERVIGALELSPAAADDPGLTDLRNDLHRLHERAAGRIGPFPELLEASEKAIRSAGRYLGSETAR